MKNEEFFTLVDGLLSRLKGTDISRMKVQWGEMQIELERGGAAAFVPVVPPAVGAPEPVTVSDSAAAAEIAENTRKVVSPIVGTFYAASSPDAKPYATVGQRVSKGDVLCIIEAMKMMNEIEADTDGVITRTPVKNGQLVEYGQTLFEMEET